MGNTYETLLGKYAVKRPRHRWDSNIKMGTWVWTGLSWLKVKVKWLDLVKTVMNKI
jgi:hypothetical protein